MKIAIFGDSYADWRPYEARTDVTVAWAYKLEQEHEVVNFAKGGSGLEWSYAQLNSCNEIDSFDRIIFVASQECRLHVNKNWHKDIHDFEQHVPGSPWSNDVSSKFYKKHIVPAAKKYYTLFDDDIILKVRQKVYLESLRNRFKEKILILGAFHCQDENKIYLDNPSLSLQRIYDIETKIIFGIPFMLGGQENDKRPCHLTKENHQFVLSMINNWLNDKPVRFEKRYVSTQFENIESYKTID